MPPLRKKETVAEIAATSDAAPLDGHNGGPPLTSVPEQCAWKVRNWARIVNIGISSVQTMVANGELEALKFGSNMVLIVTSPAEWIQRKLREQAENGPLPKISRPRKPIAGTLPPGVLQFTSERQAAADPAPPVKRSPGRPRGSLDSKPRKPRAAAQA